MTMFRTLIASAVLALTASQADALSINLPAVLDQTAWRASCAGGLYNDCLVQSYIDDVTVTFGDARFEAHFRKSFDAWNLAQPEAERWTLAGGAALEGSLTVTIFDTVALEAVGGLEIEIVDDPGETDLVVLNALWTQGLYDNYTLGAGGGIVAPFFEMDVNPDCGGSVFCPPIYPFQYVDRHFYDFPKAPWPNGFFQAQAFIASRDVANRVLTLYEGVDYGFFLSVPAPQALPLMAVAVAAFGWLRRKR